MEVTFLSYGGYELELLRVGRSDKEWSKFDRGRELVDVVSTRRANKRRTNEGCRLGVT